MISARRAGLLAISPTPTQSWTRLRPNCVREMWWRSCLTAGSATSMKSCRVLCPGGRADAHDPDVAVLGGVYSDCCAHRVSLDLHHTQRRFPLLVRYHHRPPGTARRRVASASARLGEA